MPAEATNQKCGSRAVLHDEFADIQWRQVGEG